MRKKRVFRNKHSDIVHDRVSPAGDFGRWWPAVESPAYPVASSAYNSLDPELAREASCALVYGLREREDREIRLVGIYDPQLHLRELKQGHMSPGVNCAWVFSFTPSTQANEVEQHSNAEASRIEAADVVARRVTQELEAMLAEQDEPDFRHRPSDDAYEAARRLIEAAYTHDVGSAPMPTFAPDGSGGLRIEWRSGRRIVRLIVPNGQNEDSYVYSRRDGRSEVDEPATDEALLRRLRFTFAD